MSSSSTSPRCPLPTPRSTRASPPPRWPRASRSPRWDPSKCRTQPMTSSPKCFLPGMWSSSLPSPNDSSCPPVAPPSKSYQTPSSPQCSSSSSSLEQGSGWNTGRAARTPRACCPSLGSSGSCRSGRRTLDPPPAGPRRARPHPPSKEKRHPRGSTRGPSSRATRPSSPSAPKRRQRHPQRHLHIGHPIKDLGLSHKSPSSNSLALWSSTVRSCAEPGRGATLLGWSRFSTTPTCPRAKPSWTKESRLGQSSTPSCSRSRALRR
mmetsp:Transcript_7774/g.22058  ORF Transcript_7774/g.22058 Transcript_7774/m.22058 type:complete len:264 (+) Transcript_7774:1608-2399(+)